jgi:HAE1 family hydrophobic/amphiphilic exporter-1
VLTLFGLVLAIGIVVDDAIIVIARVGLFVGIIFISAGWLTIAVPTAFLPAEDQGYLFVDIQLPDASSSNRTQVLMDKIVPIIMNDPAVKDIITVGGSSLLGGPGSNNGLAIILLKDWDDRTTPELGLKQIIPRLMGTLWSMPEAQIMVFNPPPIPGLGTSSRFDFQLQDNEGRDPTLLAQVMNGLIYEANQRSELNRVFSTYRANVPQYFLEVVLAK